MNPHDLAREWLALAPAWIQEAREGSNLTREGLLDASMPVAHVGTDKPL